MFMSLMDLRVSGLFYDIALCPQHEQDSFFVKNDILLDIRWWEKFVSCFVSTPENLFLSLFYDILRAFNENCKVFFLGVWEKN